jgi:hypothetical protein
MEISGQLHAPATLPPGKKHQYPSDRRLDGPYSQYERAGNTAQSPITIQTAVPPHM